MRITKLLKRQQGTYRILYLYFILSFVIGMGTEAYPQAGRAGAFLRIGAGARARAMGDAYSALTRGVEAVYYNPAAIHLLTEKRVMASYRFLSLDREFSFVGFAAPVKPKVDSKTGAKALNGGIALAWLRAGVNDITGRSSDGTSFGSFSNSENAFMLAFSLNPANRLSIGLVFKLLWNRFPSIGFADQTVSESGLGFDFGVLYRFSKNLALSASFKEINGKYIWDTRKIYDEDGSESTDVIPKAARYGIAVRVPGFEQITIAIDFEQFFDTKLFDERLSNRWHVGVEGLATKEITLRAGFNDGSVTAGAGYIFPLLGKRGELNYAYTSPGDRPEEEHVFTWAFHF